MATQDSIPFFQSEPDNALELDVMRLLQQAVLNEKNSPEILPYKQELVEGIQLRLKAQEETVETLDTDMDKELPKIIYQLENRRVRYLLKTYLRTRLKKIEKYAAHVLDATPEYRQRLSQRELVYCQDYFISVGRHLRETVLQHMPPNFKSLVKESDLSDSKDMIPAPNLEAYVYCRALEEVGDVMVPGDALRTEELSIGAGDTYIVRYNVVADIVKSERAVLI